MSPKHRGEHTPGVAFTRGPCGVATGNMANKLLTASNVSQLPAGVTTSEEFSNSAEGINLCQNSRDIVPLIGQL